jgi:hypothetical protein
MPLVAAGHQVYPQGPAGALLGAANGSTLPHQRRCHCQDNTCHPFGNATAMLCMPAANRLPQQLAVIE